jgi:glycogen debranching enzyme
LIENIFALRMLMIERLLRIRREADTSVERNAANCPKLQISPRPKTLDEPRDFRNWLVRLRPRWQTNYVGQGRTVLATAENGFISPAAGQGLFVNETRLLSKYEYRINGNTVQPVALCNVEQHTWLGYYIVLPPGFQPGPPDKGSGQVTAASQNSLELKLSRYVSGGVHEDVDLTNFTLQPTSFRLRLRIDADFAAIDETLSRRKQRGRKTRTWLANGTGCGVLGFRYEAKHKYDHQGERGLNVFRCAIEIHVVQTDSPAKFRDNAIEFQIHLDPGAHWHACIHMIPVMGDNRLEIEHPTYSSDEGGDSLSQLREKFVEESTTFATCERGTLSHLVSRTVEQACKDLSALRLHDLDHGDHSWTVAAGLPIYLALFGRDTLTAAWQTAMLSTELLRGTLSELVRWQGKEVDDWRDEQPGRMLHEAHTDPLSILNYIPRERYYGATTPSPLFSIALALLWLWTADKTLVAPLTEPAIKALHWLDRYGDTNGDGFYDYKSRSEKGNKNQGWKDSGDAIVYEDGGQVPAPIAMCEEQGYAYAAKLRLSELLWWLDRRDEAKHLYCEAVELKKRFNEAFWMEERGYFAMGLDAKSRKITSIGSDPGHCIATGIVEESLVRRVGDRLLQPDLFSGWGVRTLSAEHPAYNPYSYHRGSVWPVENATFALGLARYGLFDHMEQICRAQFEAAGLFDFCRLPELFSGHSRDSQHPFPAFYPAANSPQAWSASGVFTLLEAMLGVFPYAPLNLLLLDPHLPEWLPEITVANLRVAGSVLKIRFYREAGGNSEFEILEQRGTLRVLHRPSPWSLRMKFAEGIKDELTSYL